MNIITDLYKKFTISENTEVKEPNIKVTQTEEPVKPGYDENLSTTGAFVQTYQIRHNRQQYVNTMSIPDILYQVGAQDMIHLAPINYRYRPYQTCRFPITTLNNTTELNVGWCRINYTGTVDFAFNSTGSNFTAGLAGVYATSFTYDITGSNGSLLSD